MVSFLIRTAKLSDRDALFSLAKTFDLLSLPPQKDLLEAKIQTSILSFQGELPRDQAEYVFVLEDLTQKKVIGTSSIIGQHGTLHKPHYYLKLLSKTLKYNSQKKEHSMLRLCCTHQGATGIGGLILHNSYRGHPNKLGHQISLARFLYVAFFPHCFSEKFHCEFAPHLNANGDSAFWNGFGYHFTGLSYSDILKEDYKKIIKQLFPKEDIYLSLLSPEAQKTLGKISLQTASAKKMLESIYFRPLNEFHPLDGGPHYGIYKKDLKLFKEGQFASLCKEDLLNKKIDTDISPSHSEALIGAVGDKGFRACLSSCAFRTQSDGFLEISLPAEVKKILKVSPKATLFYYPLTSIYCHNR